MSAETGLAAFKQKHTNSPPEEFKNAASYDIVPTVAFLQATPVYALAASWGMRYVFTGGQDGFVRKYDFLSSLNGTQLLTISQRHMHPDSITKSGVLSAYWENEQPLYREDYKTSNDGSYIPKVSPVYALAAQAESLWVCAGLESGGISFQSTTYGDIGSVLAYLDGHKKAVCDLKLNGPESHLLSASWDKSVGYWDLKTGDLTHQYENLAGQTSWVDWQPIGGSTIGAPPPNSGARDDDDDDKSMESLFGSDDENENDKENTTNPENDASGDAKPDDSNDSHNGKPDSETTPSLNGDMDGEGGDNDNGNAEDVNGSPTPTTAPYDDERRDTGRVFLSATINGAIDIWDTRQAEKASWLAGSHSPPWCMSACWSYDGNKIYAGRRNAAVEEYDIRNCGSPSRSLRFPNISGSVSCVAAMPNNRSLLCASNDNIRIYDLESQRKTPFFIVPGHHGVVISRMLVDNSGKYLLSACGGRGWVDTSSDVALAYEISPEK